MVWQRPYDLSGSGQLLHCRPLKNPSHRKWWPRPATPSLGRGIQPPRPNGPRAAGFRHRVNWNGREGPEFCQNLPSRSGRPRRRPDPREAGPRGKLSGSRNQLYSVQTVGQEKPLPMPTHVPESESDASDEPGPQEDPPHLMARPPSDLEGDQEAAEPNQEEEPSAQLELAILNGLDISSLPALRDLSTRASTTVHILWLPVGMERATPEWRLKASQAMAFLLGGRSSEHYGSWSDALRQQPECRLDPPDTTTGRGMWTARMHNSTVCRVLDGLVSARAMGHREPEGMNEILRDIPPRRGVLPIPEPARGSPRADGTFPETGD